MVRNLANTIIFTLLATLLSCRASNQTASVREAEDPWAKKAWINKAAKALLHGAGGLSSSQTDELMPLSKDEIVEKLMSDPRFYEMALDFNLFFLGLKTEQLRSDDFNYVMEAFYTQTAAAAAWELSRSGNYFTLFNWQVPYTLVGAPIRPYPPESDGQILNDQMSEEQMRTHWLKKADDEIGSWIAEIQGSNDVKFLCDRYLNSTSGDNLTEYLNKSGTPQGLVTYFERDIKNQLNCGVIGGTINQHESIKQNLLAEAKLQREGLAMLPTTLNGLKGKIASITDLTPIAQGAFPLQNQSAFEAFSTPMWLSLPNSSTNFNRKRGAYILKTFFCDDLTPLNIVAPGQHSENKHASEPACQACHYKLDPMAGFFRDRGIIGIDFAQLPLHIHDDQLTRQNADLTHYLETWKAGPGSGRIWDVGYIRSAKREKLNTYGENLTDLFKIIRDAPESRTCLTKRLAEYTLGIDQVYDGGWIRSLANEFHEAAKPSVAPGDSSKAFKKVVKSLVLSRTFSTPDPVKGKCYDFAPDAEPSGLPCEIAYIVEKNCSSCHSSEDASNGLNLSTWQTFANGTSGFVHIDEASGQQLDTSASLNRIACGLSPTAQCGPVKLMPLKKEMDAVERATLYKWLQGQLAGGGQ